MRLLDLFSGAGGAAVGYHRAGFTEIVGVDHVDMPRYPFEFVQADALEYLAEHGHEFDVIHASPPCQAYSFMQNIHSNQNEHPDLVEPVRNLLKQMSKPYVIENVVGAPLRVDLILCGTMFGLRIIRHRIFESNAPMPLLVPTCNHENVFDPWHGTVERRDEKAKLAAVMGIGWRMTRKEVRQAIPPAYTEYIGRQLLRILEAT